MNTKDASSKESASLIFKEASSLRLLPRLNGVQVVVGSNPTTPTIGKAISN
jgi:hypothetical protein